MKISEKIICIILTAVMLFAAPAVFADGREAADYSKAKIYEELFSKENVILREDKNSELPITRGEVLRALMGLMSFVPSEKYSSAFSDIPDKALDSFAAFAADAGIISKGDLYYPDTEITYIQACKMAIEALGYGNEAKSEGGYPYGYIAEAEKLKLGKGVSGRDTLSYEDALILLGNMADTRVREIVGVLDKGCTFGTTDSFMYVYHRIYKTEGIVYADGKTYLSDERMSLAKGRVMIENTEYILADGVKCPLGSYVEAYVREENAGDTVICAGPSKNNETTIIPSDYAPAFSGNTLKYYTPEEKTLRACAAPIVIYNGKAYSYFSGKDFEISDGYIEAVDNNGNGDIDVFLIWEASFCLVDHYDMHKNVIYDQNMKSSILIDSTTLTEADFDLRDINKNDVLEFFVSKDNMFIRFELLEDIIDGTVEETVSDNGMIISGTEYKLTEYFKNTVPGAVKTGNAITGVLSKEGKLTALLKESETDYITAYLDAYEKEKGVGENVKVKLFDEKGEVKILNAANRVTVNGATKTKDEVYALLEGVKGTLIKYSLNTAGKISGLCLPSAENGFFDPKSDSADTLIRYRFKDDDTTNKITYKVFGYFVPCFVIANSTRIFCVAEEESDNAKRFSLGNGVEFLGNDTQVERNTLQPFNVSVDGYAR